MRIAAAQLPEPPHGADRIIVTGNAVVVLDGASAFEPASVPPGEYASRLAGSIAAALTDAPDAPLASVLAEAIAATAAALGLDDGDGCPSSTVAMARLAGGALDLLALGDSYVFYGTGPGGPGTGTLTDDRLAGLRLPQQRQYRERLAAGGGYDDAHRELLRALQRGQRRHRNRPGRLLDRRSRPGSSQPRADHHTPGHGGHLGRARHRRDSQHRAAPAPGRLARSRALRPRRPRPPPAGLPGLGTARRPRRQAVPALQAARRQGHRIPTAGPSAAAAPRPRASARCSQPFQGRSDPPHRLRPGFPQPEAPALHKGTGKEGTCAPGTRTARCRPAPPRAPASALPWPCPGTCTGHRDRAPLQLKARGLVPRGSLVCLRWRGLAARRPG